MCDVVSRVSRTSSRELKSRMKVLLYTALYMHTSVHYNWKGSVMDWIDGSYH